MIRFLKASERGETADNEKLARLALATMVWDLGVSLRGGEVAKAFMQEVAVALPEYGFARLEAAPLGGVPADITREREVVRIGGRAYELEPGGIEQLDEWKVLYDLAGGLGEVRTSYNAVKDVGLSTTRRGGRHTLGGEDVTAQAEALLAAERGGMAWHGILRDPKIDSLVFRTTRDVRRLLRAR